jgi:hypothetical protein
MVAEIGNPFPSARTMVLVPLPRLVLPTRLPLFLPTRTFRRQSFRSDRSGLGGGGLATAATRPSPRLRWPSTPGSDASTWRMTGTDRACPSSGHRCGAPRGFLRRTLAVRSADARVCPGVNHAGKIRQSIAIVHPLVRIWAPSWTPTCGIALTSVVSFLTTVTHSARRAFSYHFLFFETASSEGVAWGALR